MQHRYLSYLHILILIMFVYACADKEPPSIYSKKLLVFTKDSQIIQGKQFRFAYRLDSVDYLKYANQTQPLFASVLFHSSVNYLSKYEVIKLENNQGKNLFNGEFIIPKNVSSFELNLSDKFETLPYPTARVQVYRTKDSLEFNASAILLSGSKPDEFKRLIEDELSIYPQNIGIYANKWIYGLQNKLLNKDSLLTEIEYLERAFPNHRMLPALQFIAYALLKDSRVNPALEKILSAKNSVIFNHETISSMINKLLEGHPNYKSFCAQIIYNNLLSTYTKYRVDDGSLRRLINPDTSLYVINEILKNEDYPYNKLKKGEILYNRFKNHFKDSIQVLDMLADEIYRDLNDQALFEKGYDQNHLFYQTRMMSYKFIANIQRLKGNYSEAIELLKTGASSLEQFDSQKAIPFLIIGNIQSELEQYDSAINSYCLSLKYNPNFPFPKDSLRAMFNRSNQGQSIAFDKWLDSMINITPYEEKRKTRELPNIELAGSKSVNLSNPVNKIVVIEFFTTTCRPCYSNAKDIIEYINDPDRRDDVEFYLVSSEERDRINKYYNKLKYNFPEIDNASELMTFFEIKAFPVTIVINKQGNIIYNFSGGYKESGISQLLKGI